jgi:hypothetical protein
MPHRTLCAFALACTLIAPAAAQAHTQIYVLAGQSNMVGQGKTTATLPLLRHVRKMGDDGRLHVTTADVFGEGIGPAASFVRGLRTRDQVVLVPCAVSGSSIEHWVPGGDYYERCVHLTRAATRIVHAKVSGILYWQGESDTNTIEQAAAWQQNFTRFASGFRAAVRAPHAPLLFTVLGTTKYGYKYPGWSTVRHEQAHMALPVASNRVHVLGLEMQDDLHYTAAAQCEIGERFAAALRGVRR